MIFFGQIFLHFTAKKKDSDPRSGEGETLQYFWRVSQPVEFENVGFSRQVDNYKYLTCADCEIPCFGKTIEKKQKLPNLFSSSIFFFFFIPIQLIHFNGNRNSFTKRKSRHFCFS